MTEEERTRIRDQIIHEISTLEKAKQCIVILQNVLLRVDTHSYGICIKYNKPIPFERLKTVPSTTQCLYCR